MPGNTKAMPTPERAFAMRGPSRWRLGARARSQRPRRSGQLTGQCHRRLGLGFELLDEPTGRSLSSPKGVLAQRADDGPTHGVTECVRLCSVPHLVVVVVGRVAVVTPCRFRDATTSWPPRSVSVDDPCLRMICRLPELLNPRWETGQTLRSATHTTTTRREVKLRWGLSLRKHSLCPH